MLSPFLDDFWSQNSTQSCLICAALDVRKCQGIQDNFWKAKHDDPEAVGCHEAAKPDHNPEWILNS